jgi:hypothetical protein
MTYSILTFLLALLVIALPLSSSVTNYIGNYVFSIGMISFILLTYLTRDPDCELGCTAVVGILFIPTLLFLLIGLIFGGLNKKSDNGRAKQKV